jgi:proteic killer suppression protein
MLTGVGLQATVDLMRIRNFVHKGLKKLYEDDNPRGVAADTVDKLHKMLAFLDDMQDAEELYSLPSWKAHTITGDRKGTWSLNVTRNRRLTFRIEGAEAEVCDVNLEDYHWNRRSIRHAYQEPSPSRRLYSDGNHRPCGVVCDGCCGNPGDFSADALQPA